MSIKTKTLGWGAATTATTLIVYGKAATFLPDAGGPDGDHDADDTTIGYHTVTTAHGVTHQPVTAGGSWVPEGFGAILVAAVTLAAFAGLAARQHLKHKPGVQPLLIGGLFAAMLALIVTPVSLTGQLPKIGAIVGAFTALAVVSYTIKVVDRKRKRGQPVPPASARTWPLAEPAPQPPVWPLPEVPNLMPGSGVASR